MFYYYFMISFLLIFSQFVNQHLQADNYKVMSIHLRKADNSSPTGINNHGQVVGVVNYDKIFFWDEKTGFKVLGTSYLPPQINNLGHVVGTLVNFDESHIQAPSKLFIWKPETGVQLIENPENIDEESFEIHFNDHDQLLLSFLRGGTEVWYIWENGKYKEIEGLENYNLLVSHFSNQQIISATLLIDKGEDNSFDYTPVQYDVNHQKLTYIDKNLRGDVIQANEQGEVFGIFDNNKTYEMKFFFWSPTKGFKELPDNFLPISMNNKGEFIGIQGEYGSTYAGELSLYDGHHFRSIEEINPWSPEENVPVHVQGKAYINDQSQMTGTEDDGRAIFLEPISETK